jgi:hypothetical protein
VTSDHGKFRLDIDPGEWRDLVGHRGAPVGTRDNASEQPGRCRTDRRRASGKHQLVTRAGERSKQRKLRHEVADAAHE